MKTNLLRAFIVLSLIFNFISFSSYAKKGISYNFIASKDAKSVVLSIENIEGAEVYIHIEDMDKQVILERKIKDEDKYSTVLDFNWLKVGKYIFTMSFEDNKVDREFFITPDKNAIFMNYSMTSLNTGLKISVNFDKLLLIIGNNLNGKVKLTLYNNRDKIMYEKRFIAGAMKLKRLDLSNFPEGTYTATLIYGDKKYSDSFTIL
ncbi:DUF3244 domain-containing protein [Flammeovirga yaeyamensis]|uniref:DUF3244 domain-containing protein n=1 Tax=Flammeovirga yaeyamensis TaxID=367791 RepID=A0AAX1N5S5_9BACT|nr:MULTISPECIES: hypothetical protein [Flammeovirga]ANQ47396.1 hypothetical protein MY04_0013 [Flammeovirga sp. MY04]MBB3698442.1 hypothetical protein [Flammeovirga yaeyamensis]NMF34208.1 hypothetical protein [Flammeovirga yaeyamensis]QWG01193.1 DUF3244 domain-containing protein [Flammeovirga yaeyamensis]